METPKILKLDEVVVNRIAAGEVIQRPANAIKEIIENSLDAKSTSIQVIVKSGGLKLLQIVDDGCGIRKEDMNIVCERFTTSKLSSFDDLKSISTYGFRGEALASISHVAHLTITTRTADSPCAHKAKYEDGKMVPFQPNTAATPKPCAGNKGTQIAVEDLFYNVTVRRKALKNPNEEHLKIIDVVSKYAIHNPGVAFTLKKFGENIGDVRTQKNSTIVDNIKNIYGQTVARELLEVTHNDQKLGFRMSGYVSNANYSMKKFVFLLFINHRLVESNALRKALDTVYVNYLPKDKRPFVYMSIEINPRNVDVNVHPTKHEVKFLHEDLIIEDIQKCVETKLLGANESRQYYTQMLLPKMVAAGLDAPISGILSDQETSHNDKKKMYAHEMVRTDSRERKLEAFFSPNTATATDNYSVRKSFTDLDATTIRQIPTVQQTRQTRQSMEDGSQKQSDVECIEVTPIQTNVANVPNTSNVPTEEKVDSNEGSVAEFISGERQKTCVKNGKQVEKQKQKRNVGERQINLTSLRNLRKIINDSEHLGLTNLLEDHKFVGCVNKRLTLVQHLTRLYLVNSQKLSQELFYQILMHKFGNFGYMQLSSAAPIFELVLLALNSPESGWTPDDGEKEDLAKHVVNLLSSKAEMLLDYFSLEINDKNEIVSLPLLLEKYTPNLNGLPMFVLRLATEVTWDAEQECFESFALECSRFYAFGPDPLPTGHDDSTSNNQSWKHTVEHVLFPAFRTSLLLPKKFSEDGTFLEVANLPDLYKVFERC